MTPAKTKHPKASLTTQSHRKKLVRLSILFIMIVVVALIVLVRYTFSQLQWESFHQNRLQAESLAARIDQGLQNIIDTEQQRPVSQYRFLSLNSPTSIAKTNKPSIRRSPLASLPLTSTVPGVVGYFQLNSNNQFVSPVLPDSAQQAEEYGVPEPEYLQRIERAKKIANILINNKIAINTEGNSQLSSTAIANTLTKNSGKIAKEKVSEAFDRLKSQKPSRLNNSLGRVEDLLVNSQNAEFDKRSRLQQQKKDTVYKQKVTEQKPGVQRQSTMPKSVASRSQVGALKPAKRSPTLFESEVEPFQVSLLDTGHIAIFRRVWTQDQRLVQGMLINKMDFIDSIIQNEFSNSGLSEGNRLAIAYQGDFLAAYGELEQGRYGYLDSARQLSGTLLYKAPLLSPFDDFHLVFTMSELSAGASGRVVIASASILLLTVLLGTWLFNRYATAQESLMAQQQDFISSVSHELKTPLTSIRMYGEMLKEGWVSSDKKHEYYHFIFEESERLSRLINNVLQLAKLTRNTLEPVLETQTVSKLISLIESKLSGQAVSESFELSIQASDACLHNRVGAELDEDLFVQIMINIIDNAIKYSKQAEVKKIAVHFSLTKENRLLINVRDYGPGIAPEQLQKIFSLFYRTESELTRETKGTGIGLALVNEYVQLMEGDIEVVNQTPGVMVSMSFPLSI